MTPIDTHAEAERLIDLLDRGAVDFASAMDRLRDLATRPAHPSTRPARGDDLFDALEKGTLDVRGVLERLKEPRVEAVEPPPVIEPTTSGKLALRAPAVVDAAARAPNPPRPARIRLVAAAAIDAPPRAPAMPATREVVTVTRHGAHVAIVAMGDVDRQNMLTKELGEALQKAFAALARDESVRVVVLRGDDRWFSAGGTPETVSMVRAGSVRFTANSAYRLPLDCPLPTVAAMSGNAIGGGLVMGLYADAVIMAEDRKYSANFMRHGITPGVGATHMVPLRMGALLGAEMLYSARLYSGRELRERGAPIELVPAAAVLQKALARAEELAAAPREQLVRLKGRLTDRLRRDVDAAIEDELRLHHEAARGRETASPSLGDHLGSPLHVERDGAICFATINRPRADNSLNAELVAALHAAMDRAEADPACRALVLRGSRGTFCSGMDLEEAAAAPLPADSGRSPYMELLKRFAASPLIVIAAADGKVLAGGVGLAAAADLTLIGEKTTFALSEAVFGLLPAQVMPYLVRRVGFQTAYRMTLTATPLAARDAERYGLADEVAADLDARVRWYARRFNHISRETVLDAKRYFRKMWLIDDAMEEAAVEEFNRLVKAPRFMDRVRRFLGTDAAREDG